MVALPCLSVEVVSVSCLRLLYISASLGNSVTTTRRAAHTCLANTEVAGRTVPGVNDTYEYWRFTYLLELLIEFGTGLCSLNLLLSSHVCTKLRKSTSVRCHMITMGLSHTCRTTGGKENNAAWCVVVTGEANGVSSDERGGGRVNRPICPPRTHLRNNCCGYGGNECVSCEI